MNVSLRWLRSLAPGIPGDPGAVAERLTLRGAAVERTVRLDEGLEDVVVARVRTVDEHPNADRLRLCTVDDGRGGEALQVVCGAPVVVAGALYPLAPVGASLPGGMQIRKAKIRGEVSEGMLCSERELGLGRDQSGIMRLPDDLEPGRSLTEALGLDDVLLDVEVSPNRGDLLSHLGIAREAAPNGVAGVTLPDLPGAGTAHVALQGGGPEVSEGGVTVRIEDLDLCPRYLAARIRGLRVGPSPAWLASRLRAAGVRPVNNVVDATNYVMLEVGQPLHAFDLNRLEAATVVVRRARAGEGIRTLDGVERGLEAGMLAICDARCPVAVAGVMGGEESEVTSETRDVLLECALFQAASVRATRKALDLSTDASYRFERWVDPEGVERALRRAAGLIAATAGGTVDLALDASGGRWSRPVVELRPARVGRVLGLSWRSRDLADLLEPLGFEIRGSPQEDPLKVAVPGFRGADVTREVDLIEEVARAWGYDRFPADMGPYRPGTVPDHPLFRVEDRLRDLLVGRGFLEMQTAALAPPGEGEVEVQNPVSARESRLRAALLPGVLGRVEFNFARGARSLRLFEIGTVFRNGPGAELPVETTRIAGCLTGLREPGHWSGEDRPVDVWDLKGVLEEVAEAAGWPGAPSVDPGPPDRGPWDPALSFTVRVGDEVRGGGGRVRPGSVDAPAWAGDVWGFELTLPAEPAEASDPVVRPLPAYPGVERDLALLVPEGLPSARVAERIREAAGELLAELEIFDVFEGEGIPEGTRSVAFRLRFRSPDRTLTDQDVDRATEAVVRKLREETRVEPRG